MSRPGRNTFIPFGSTINAASEICEFGTPATGSPVYTNVIATLMAGATWIRGWAGETVADNRPFLEDMNAVDYVFSSFINYILTVGVPEYDGGSTYFLYSILQYNGVCYQCINDLSGAGISAILPTNTTYWKLLIQPIVGFGSWVSKSANTIYQASTDGFVIGYAHQTSGNNIFYFYTDSSSSPSTLRQYAGGPSQASNSSPIFGVVKKNDYWEVVGGGSVDALYWIPLGS